MFTDDCKHKPFEYNIHKPLEHINLHRSHIVLPLRGAGHANHLYGSSCCTDLPEGNEERMSPACPGACVDKTGSLRRTDARTGAHGLRKTCTWGWRQTVLK